MTATDAGGLRCVRFEDQSAFLEATKAFDDSFMSSCIGSAMDYLARSKGGQDDTPGTCNYSTVFKGEQLLYVW